MLPSFDCINYHVANRLPSVWKHNISRQVLGPTVQNDTETTSRSHLENLRIRKKISFCVELRKCAQSAN